MQKLIVYTKEKIMDVYQDDKLIKIFNDVWIGKKGYALEKDMHEGGEKTPLGIYNLGISFGINDQNIDYPYIKLDKNSYWVDDINSRYYNNFVEVKNKINTYNYPYVKNIENKDFNSAEHLIDYPKQYEYAYFIEYNIKQEKGKGSAIFLHVKGDKGYTGGCIALNRDEMIYLFKILKYNEKPRIIITDKTRQKLN